MFVDRQKELAFLNGLLTRRQPGPAQMILLYGRRRVGKSELLLHWSQQSGIPSAYWEAVKEAPELQRSRVFGKLLGVPPTGAPTFRSWVDLWDAAAALLGDRRQILILDELTYAAEADPAFLSALQYAWDQHFQRSNVILALSGSQVRVMEAIMSSQSPLYGRLTGQWRLEPLPFSALAEFFPKWKLDELVALYAFVGGIPAYLRWLNPALGLEANLREVVLSEGSMFLAETDFLLYEEVRELKNYLAVLKAIGQGAHTLEEISAQAFLPTVKANAYLATLQELRLVERRLPATVHQRLRPKSRAGRYHLSDPYFRFYFHFVKPALDDAPFDPGRVLALIKANLRAFVGGTAFEELARQWVLRQGQAGQLSFYPEVIGSHWDRKAQVDVVAINWQSHDILLGECKWGEHRVDREVVRELIDIKTPLVLQTLPNMGQGWKVQYAFFARQGFTPAAQQAAGQVQATLIDLKRLVAELP